MAFSEIGQKLLKHLIVNDDEIDFRIKQGTEMYRKGFGNFFTLKDSQGHDIEKAEIRLKQKSHEYLFGCNAFMINQFPEKEQNKQYEESFAKLFNEAVIPFYWSDLEPEDGELRFKSGSKPIYRRPPTDEVLGFCEKNNITPKGHPLCWHCFSPKWAPDNQRDMMRRLERRIKEISERYGERILLWDCVNEAQTRNPEEKAAAGWNDPDYPDNHVEEVFKIAERYLPTSDLLYNDDRMWWHFNGDYTPVYLLMKKIQESGCKVKGLGLQFHMFQRLYDQSHMFMNSRNIYKCLDQYAKLHVPINFSEVSIVSRRDLGDGDHFQELVTEKLYRLWFSHPATNSIVWWNLVDGTAAYAPLGSEEGENYLRAGLVNYDFTEKPAYKVLDKLINHEWQTETVCNYDNQAVNKFHGFYGDYEAEIHTNAGVFNKQISLNKDSDNRYDIVLK